MTAYNRIFDVAIENYGLITSSCARTLGIPAGTLVDLAHRGRLIRIGQGVYQLTQYLPTERDAYAQAVALVGEGAYLFGESVIAMLMLAPTNPDVIYVATPLRVRKKLAKGIVVCAAPKDEQPSQIEGVPSQCVADALISALSTMSADRIKAACDKAFELGKINEEEKRKVMHEVRKRNATSK